MDDTHQAGWPKFGIYELWEGKSSEPDTFAVIDGPDPVSARRQAVLHSRTDACDNFTFVVLGPEQQRNFVARWLGIDPDDVPWKSEATGEIVYRSDQQFYTELREFITREQEKYRSTGRALVAKNLMTASEQEESLPSIDLAFDDRRGPNARWIPDPDPLGAPHVTWPKQPKRRHPNITSR